MQMYNNSYIVFTRIKRYSGMKVYFHYVILKYGTKLWLELKGYFLFYFAISLNYSLIGDNEKVFSDSE